MSYPTRKLDGGPVAIVAVDGKFDDGFIPLIEGLLAERKTWLLLNLEKSTLVRGDHIEWMIEAHHKCHGKGGSFALTNVPRDLSYVLSIMQLDQFFRMFPGEEDGVSAFAASSAPAVEQPVSSDEVAALTDIELPTPAAKRPRREQALQDKADREQRIELFVRHVAPGMDYLRVFETLAKQSKGATRRIDPGQLSQAAKHKKGDVTRVLKHLIELRICRKTDGGEIQYNPGPAAEADIAEFLRMWNNPANHGKVYRWVYHEQQQQAAERGGPIAWLKRLFGGKE